jgi:predicted helicase
LTEYYVASLNIEHACYELTGEYAPFEGMCFVDTLDLEEGARTLRMFTEANAERIEREQKTRITVIIGNPPYNVGQLNENDNNKNRKYDVVDQHIRETYVRGSQATLKTKLYDPYVRFFRWATDRLGSQDGILCFVSNNSFLEQNAFDGMRQHLEQDFTRIYHIDLHGNVRKNPKLSGTTHNVFGIQVGVGITVAVRSSRQRRGHIRYHRVPEFWRREEKLGYLAGHSQDTPLQSIRWQMLKPDDEHTWLVAEHAHEFRRFLMIGTKEKKEIIGFDPKAVFREYSLGVSTNRDTVVYDFDKAILAERVEQFCEEYNAEVDRFRRRGGQVQDVDDFVSYDSIKWSETLKRRLQRGEYAVFEDRDVLTSMYRPFTKRSLYYNAALVDRPALFRAIFPTITALAENQTICVSTPASEKPFYSVVVNTVPNLAFVGFGGGCQCFPFYVYDEDGSNRRENVTDWALAQFRAHYGDDAIAKWDIFYYVYGLLHHPGYRTKYADNLKRDLPHIPFAPDFRAFADAGRELAEWHLGYEGIEPHPLAWVETPDAPLSYRVEKMRLNREKTALKVNDTLILRGIPPEVYGYQLGNRSALEWVIDQYRVKEDKRSGIVSDPNNPDDPEYIVRLVGQVVQVSLETVRIVAALPEDFGG